MEELLEHIYCEYRWGIISNSTQDSLNESYGQIPEIDEYVQCFREFVKEKIFPYIKDGGTYSAVINTPSVFYMVDKPFFNACNIEIIGSIREGKLSWNSYYNQNESYFNENVRFIKIKVTAGAANYEQLIWLLSTNFAHEVTHAYDDYKTGGRLKKVREKSNYDEKFATWTLGGTENREELGRALYLLTPIERNAIIGQISAELNGKSARTPSEAAECVKLTRAYKEYEWLSAYIKKINNTTDGLAQNEILYTYTKWISHNKHKIKNPDVKYNVRENLTYEGFLSEMNSLFNTWKRKFLNCIGKVAYLHYCKTAAPMINRSENDETKIPKAKTNVNEGIEKERVFYLDFLTLKENLD